MGWKTPYLMVKKGNVSAVQAISAPIFRKNQQIRQDLCGRF